MENKGNLYLLLEQEILMESSCHLQQENHIELDLEIQYHHIY